MRSASATEVTDCCRPMECTAAGCVAVAALSVNTAFTAAGAAADGSCDVAASSLLRLSAVASKERFEYEFLLSDLLRLVCLRFDVVSLHSDDTSLFAQLSKLSRMSADQTHSGSSVRSGSSSTSSSGHASRCTSTLFQLTHVGVEC